MGTLAERLSRSDRAILLNRRRGRAIEQDVCRRLGIKETSRRLAQMEVAFSTIEGGRRQVHVVEVREPAGADAHLAYGIKAPHGSEPWGAEVASDLGIGPAVLDVSQDGVLVEEFFPEGLNIRYRRPGPEEYEPYAKALSRLLLAMMRTGEGKLLCHGDERSDHVFILGRGEDIQVRLIDWGRADTWPLSRFPEWGKDQFYWFHEHLSFEEPRIWTAFTASLAEGCPEPPGRAALGKAYMGFVGYQALGPADGAPEGSAARFLEFSVGCGRLELDLGWFNEFVEACRDLAGEELVQAYRSREAAAGGTPEAQVP